MAKFEELMLVGNNSAAHHLASRKFSQIEVELKKIEADPRYQRLGTAHREIVARIRAILNEVSS